MDGAVRGTAATTAPGVIADVRADRFDALVGANDIVLVDFWAPWCGPCRSFAPVFARMAAEQPDIRFVKVNTDEEQALAQHFAIRAIPTLMILRERVIVFQQAGALSYSALGDLIAQVRALDMVEVRRGSRAGAPPEQQGHDGHAAA